MSAILTPATPAAAAPAGPRPAGPLKVAQTRVVRSEWIKFRSLRSTLWTLLIAVVLMIGIGALFSAVIASQYHTFSASNRAAFSAVGTSLDGITFAVIAFGVLACS
jgi:ABC-2 type transport system permease protein